MDDLISRDSLYEKAKESENEALKRLCTIPKRLPDGTPNTQYICWLARIAERTRFKEMIYDEPSVQQTLNGYPLEHLAFIARVMEKEGVTPEAVAKMLDDVGGVVVRLVLEEIQRQAESGFEDASHPFADDVMMASGREDK